jgi:hypothetical protein
VALRVFVQAMSAQKNCKTLAKMRGLLERSVGERAVSARQVCDVVLSHEFLKYENELFWTASFHLVRRVIGGVDYKGVREIMKACIDKVRVPVIMSTFLEKQTTFAGHHAAPGHRPVGVAPALLHPEPAGLHLRPQRRSPARLLHRGKEEHSSQMRNFISKCS